MTDERDRENAPRSSPRLLWLVGVGLALLFMVGLYLLRSGHSAKPREQVGSAQKDHDEGHSTGDGVKLSPEALEAAGIEFATAVEQSAVASLRVPGTVEVNQLLSQEVTPLVAGRVERVLVAPGDRVRAGSPLATLTSPQIAEMHGKLHESETRLRAAERNLIRVQKAENRAAVIAAKAKLDEAEATLRRTQKLIDLGAGAGKDLIAAETAYKTAKAEYDFQSNISLNKEMAEAFSEVETSRVDVQHIRDGLRALGAPVAEDEPDHHKSDTSLVTLRAPISGRVIVRLVNSGAVIEPGKGIFTVANLSRLWVIANVPEARVSRLREGARAEARVGALGEEVISGRVTYIDPVLNEETRTARVRVEVANPRERLKVGMFVDVDFQTVNGEQDKELVIPDGALQRLGDRVVVFLPKEHEQGHFEVRDVEVGGLTGSLRRVINGLKAGDRVVTRGSFTLKTQLLKSELKDDH